MRFKNKPDPKDGETRIRKVFLWWPTRIENTTYWLESIEYCERYACNYPSFQRFWHIELVLFKTTNSELTKWSNKYRADFLKK